MKCEYCDKSFLIYLTFAEYIKKSHWESPLKCKYCEKSFIIIYYLSNKRRNRTGKNLTFVNKVKNR